MAKATVKIISLGLDRRARKAGGVDVFLDSRHMVNTVRARVSLTAYTYGTIDIKVYLPVKRIPLMKL